MVYFHRATQQSIPVAKHSGDVVFDSNLGTSEVDNETVPVVGPWIDTNGSNVGLSSKAQQQFAGISNRFKGTIAGKTGAKLGNLNEVGENADTTRRRKKQIYVKLDK